MNKLWRNKKTTYKKGLKNLFRAISNLRLIISNFKHGSFNSPSFQKAIKIFQQQRFQSSSVYFSGMLRRHKAISWAFSYKHRPRISETVCYTYKIDLTINIDSDPVFFRMRLSLRISAEMVEHFSQSSPEKHNGSKKEIIIIFCPFSRARVPSSEGQGEGREKLEDYFPICFFIAQRLPVLVFS